MAAARRAHAEAEAMRRRVEAVGICKLLHFTDVENIARIAELGKICGKDRLVKLGPVAPGPGPPDDQGTFQDSLGLEKASYWDQDLSELPWRFRSGFPEGTRELGRLPKIARATFLRRDSENPLPILRDQICSGSSVIVSNANPLGAERGRIHRRGRGRSGKAKGATGPDSNSPSAPPSTVRCLRVARSCRRLQKGPPPGCASPKPSPRETSPVGPVGSNSETNRRTR